MVFSSSGALLGSDMKNGKISTELRTHACGKLEIDLPITLTVESRYPELFASDSGRRNVLTIVIDPPEATKRYFLQILQSPPPAGPRLHQKILRCGKTHSPFKGMECLKEEFVNPKKVGSSWLLGLKAGTHFIKVQLMTNTPWSKNGDIWERVIASLRWTNA